MPRPETIALWRQRIERFDAADMTVAQFCQNEGVSQPSFYQWKRTIRQMSQQPESPAVRFRPVRVAAAAIDGNPLDTQTPLPESLATPMASTTIELPGGVRIRIEVPTQSAESHAGAGLDQEARA